MERCYKFLFTIASKRMEILNPMHDLRQVSIQSVGTIAFSAVIYLMKIHLLPITQKRPLLLKGAFYGVYHCKASLRTLKAVPA
ncbi:hypothetical protein BWI97_10210 [Siphonobacter sp. BAB-5405]|nr:hypothetical protein BWI97_10210 [Siphonobacter sp. BAB-5405]